MLLNSTLIFGALNFAAPVIFPSTVCKGPALGPPSAFYFPPWTPAELPCKINYLPLRRVEKKHSPERFFKNKSVFSSLFAAFCQILHCCTFHVWKGADVAPKRPNENLDGYAVSNTSSLCDITKGCFTEIDSDQGWALSFLLSPKNPVINRCSSEIWSEFIEWGL